MRPQFVDFDGDGHLDVFAGTFDGSPHVARGSAAGFLEPRHVLDPDGQRLRLSEFWNYDAKKWDSGAGAPEGHCTAALAFDWDADGDLDVLMADYRSGKLFRRMNHGSAAEPRFGGTTVAVRVGGKPFAQSDGLSTPVVVDWDGDGLEDLVCSGYGDPYGDEAGGGIWWYRNVGARGEPRFADGRVLVPPSRKGTAEPLRPDSGLYVDPVDVDGDGRLDLLVGGYSHWTPPPRELTTEEEAQADALEARIAEKQAALQELYRKLSTLEGLDEEEREAATAALFESAEYLNLNAELESDRALLQGLRPGPMREAFVWLYRREG